MAYFVFMSFYPCESLFVSYSCFYSLVFWPEYKSGTVWVPIVHFNDVARRNFTCTSEVFTVACTRTELNACQPYWM